MANAASGSTDIYLCPNSSPTICTSNYFNCERIDDTVCDTATEQRFTCTDTSTECVKDVLTDCCPPTAEGVEQFYCPYSQECVTDSSACCQLDPSTPIYCEESQTCVTHAYECCSNFLSATNPMEKCQYEDKCVPTSTQEHCFTPF